MLSPHHIRNFFIGVFTCLFLWLSGLLIFAFSLPQPVALESVHTACDGVVVFTGGKRRLPFAYALFEKMHAHFLLISGVDQGVSLGDLFDNPKLPQQKHRITLGTHATNTHTNALETYTWAKKRDIKRICIVTHEYHMPRSLLELRTYFTQDSLTPLPLPRKHPFWKNGDSFVFLVSEYQKFCLAYLRQKLTQQEKDLP